MMTLPEWQCRPHSADYIWRGPSPLTIRKEQDSLTREITAFHAEWLRSTDNPIYLDGRPRPPDDALHSWGGFATGKWEGDMLTVTITHLEGRLHPPQRHAAQRQGDGHRTLASPRRFPDRS